MLRRLMCLGGAALAAAFAVMGIGGRSSPVAPSIQLASAQPAGIQPEEGDNSDCFVCHIDFDGEEIVEKHIAQKLTCRSCHGPSEPHRQDETLMTKPDILWGRAEVEAMCRQCHAEHKDPDKVAAFRAEWLNRARPNGRFIGDDPVCTDCHGEHTIRKQR